MTCHNLIMSFFSKCRGGETGRHSGLKIRRASMRVQLPSLALFAVCFFCYYNCGGNVETINECVDGGIVTLKDARILEEPEDSCGNFTCERFLGETYWNCLDCIDLRTGGPVDGYCGDGICFNESMFECWKDCKPMLYNPEPEIGPGPGPF